MEQDKWKRFFEEKILMQAKRVNYPNFNHEDIADVNLGNGFVYEFDGYSIGQVTQFIKDLGKWYGENAKFSVSPDDNNNDIVMLKLERKETDAERDLRFNREIKEWTKAANTIKTFYEKWGMGIDTVS